MKVFYARVSTEEQNEARQMKIAKDVEAEKVYLDKASGRDADRPQLKAMLDFVRSGDVVYCESFSRLARNTKDLLQIIDRLTQQGVDLVSVKEKFETHTPQGKFMLTVFAALYEMERETIRERQREGIEIAKAAGKYKGRKRVEVNERKLRAACKMWRNGEITAREAQKRAGLTASTFYRRVSEMGL